MGVGVYNTKIGNPEVGETFIVSGLLYDHGEAYEKYLGEVDELLAVDQQTFMQEQHDDHYHELIQTIQSSSREFFDAVQKRLDERVLTLLGVGTEEDRQATFDPDFRLAYDYCDQFEVGIRGWEHDYIVGVAMASDPRDDDPMESILEHGLPIDDLVDQRLTMAASLNTWLKHSLMKNGFECSYKTGGYTSALYERECRGGDAEGRRYLRQPLRGLAAHTGGSDGR